MRERASVCACTRVWLAVFETDIHITSILALLNVHGLLLYRPSLKTHMINLSALNQFLATPYDDTHILGNSLKDTTHDVPE